MRILITGGAGFVGSHLVAKLLDTGATVIVLDNLYTGSLSNLPLENRRLCIIEHDVCEPWDLPVTQIYHLACPASPIHYGKDPVQTLRTNFLGTLNALRQAQTYRASLLFTSTSEVYGDPEQTPQSESYWGNVNPYGVRSCYDEGKRVAESLCYSFAAAHDVRVRVARIFNTYGPRMALDDGRVVSNFFVQALQGKPLTIFGDGSQTRSLCYVDDLVEGLVRLMAAEGPKQGAPVNLGNPHEQSVLRLAEQVLELVGSSSALRFMPLPQDDPKRRCPDISRAKAWLKWRPKIDLDEGLKRCLPYFKELVYLQQQPS